MFTICLQKIHQKRLTCAPAVGDCLRRFSHFFPVLEFSSPNTKIFHFFQFFPKIQSFFPRPPVQLLYAPSSLNPADGGPDASVFQSQTHMQIFRSIWPAWTLSPVFPESAHPTPRFISLRGPVLRPYAPVPHLFTNFLQKFYKNFTNFP